MKHNSDDSNDIIELMVDGILGKEKPNITEQEKETRNKLAGRASEYFMFMDDDEEEENGK